MVELVYTGKTKDVYQAASGDYILIFKDEVTGTEGVFDPGANTVGLTMMGAGEAGLKLSVHYFKLLEEHGIPTHFVAADVAARRMRVKAAQAFGKGIEIICRYRAVGSFYRRYRMYAQEGQPLAAFVEFTLKDDACGDPPISQDALEMLGLVTPAQYGELKTLTKKTAALIKADLDNRGLELYDLKLEFGLEIATGRIILIDEISGGNMRVYRGSRGLDPLELAQAVLQH